MGSWKDVKNVLVVRLDNMGDLLMSAPAIRALKCSFNCKITLLTSSMASGMARYISAIDDVVVYDVPWVKTNDATNIDSFSTMATLLKAKNFDAAVIFTVFSQNPLPAAMLTALAHIPRRLAYCRENPYALLTDWVPEKEPYTLIRHQVKRDLDLVASVGANVDIDDIVIDLPNDAWPGVQQKLSLMNFNFNKPWIVIHPGVSEVKRQYSVTAWRACIERLTLDLGMQIIITGTISEVELVNDISNGLDNIYSLCGKISLEEFIILIKHAPLIISVNTSTIHIASATKTKVIVLYAKTNPQHTPWKTIASVLTFPVPLELQSKNEVLKFVQDNDFMSQHKQATPENVLHEVETLLKSEHHQLLTDVIR